MLSGAWAYGEDIHRQHCFRTEGVFDGSSVRIGADLITEYDDIEKCKGAEAKRQTLCIDISIGSGCQFSHMACFVIEIDDLRSS